MQGATLSPALAIALAVVASFTVLMALPSHIVQDGMLDPYFYTGLIADYGDLVARYGTTYYSTRIAHIMPAAAIFAWFGPEHGYIVHKTLYLGASVAASYFIARRFLGAWLSLLPAAWMVVSPQVVGAYLHDYGDGSGLTYSLLAMAFILYAFPAKSRRVHWRAAVAGMMLAFAINTNPILIAVCGATGATWVAVNWREWRRALTSLGWLVVGFVATYAAMCIFMRVRYPQFGWFFESASWGMANSAVFNAGGAPWFVPLSAMIDHRIVYPILDMMVVGALIAACIRRDLRSTVVIFAAGQLAVVALAFWFLHYRESAVLSLPLYNVHLMPAVLVAIIALVSLAAQAAHKVAAGTAVAALAGVLAWSPYAAAPYNSLYDSAKWPREHDVYRGAWKLMEVVREYAPAFKGPAGFWYANGNHSLSSVQSTHFWGYGRVMAQANTTPGMPDMNSLTRDLISKRRFLILLAEKPEEIDAGISALREHEPRHFDIVTSGRYQGVQWGYNYAVVEFRSRSAHLPGRSPRVARIAASWFPAISQPQAFMALFNA